MKRFMLWTAILMAAALIAVTIYYQTSDLVAGSFHVLFQKNHPQKAVKAKNPLYAETTQKISYTLQNNQLHVTYDKGKQWTTVPVSKDQLFGGEYSGNRQELIDGSYLLTKSQTVFLTEQATDHNEMKLALVMSEDQGKTWRHAVVTSYVPGIRFRKIGFPASQFGYVIVSADRTMAQEGTYIYLTPDGGDTWKKTKSPATTALIADGGFVSALNGFMSYGTINPDRPRLYVTRDGGKHWLQASIHMPSKYSHVFVQAETPEYEDDHLMLLINQGESGDYKGNKVKGKFISRDQGRTWTFLKEVAADETD
ncbi:glycoside hydrolase [Sporolactobacillus sp. CPB3-1]|uniref:Glycoside hydrolase n=1 Tax=Sporolactobacillus mangiferae TaxID=2940498 RepID=A0ABT0M7F5_9BACL|nr:sialidase family protein [Sporolactobacillus mangiferae]MCL1630794.1 glycoside hydrolase [Sporolactobacillus mangiferae]